MALLHLLRPLLLGRQRLIARGARPKIVRSCAVVDDPVANDASAVGAVEVGISQRARAVCTYSAPGTVGGLDGGDSPVRLCNAVEVVE